MLEITRRRGESLIIKDDTIITVERVVSKKIIFGINAPKDVKIVREELLDKSVKKSN